MIVAAKTVHIAPDSELSALLSEAAETGARLVVDTGEATYRLRVELERISGETVARRLPTPEEIERSRAGIRESAGGWPDIDAEAFKAYIRERRRTSSRPPVEL